MLTCINTLPFQSWGQTMAPNIHTNIVMPSHASLVRGPQQSMNGPGGLPMGVTPLQATASSAVLDDGRRALPEVCNIRN
jgi:hypothetical protein